MTSTVNVARDDAASIYNSLRSVPIAKWQDPKTTAAMFGPDTEGAQKISAAWGDKGDSSTLQLGLKVVSRAAHDNDFDTFYDAIKAGELPPVRLSPTEMEQLRGGVAFLIPLMFLLDCSIYAWAATQILK